MTNKKIWIAMGLFSATAVVGTAAWQKGGDEINTIPKEMQAYGTPGEQHKLLAQRAGKWDYKIKVAMTPGAPMMDAAGTLEVEPVLDGRYLAEKVSGPFQGGQFEGMGWIGYNNVKKKFCSVWIDNMSTGFATGEGDYDAATKTFTYATKCTDPMTGKESTGRCVEKWTDNDNYTSHAYAKGPDGKETLVMEMSLKRAK